MALIKTPTEINIMAEAGKILRMVIAHTAAQAKEGVSLLELDNYAEELTRKLGAEPAFLNYKPNGAKKPYPATICASVNEVIVHGVPNKYKLKSGDVLKLDFGARLQGWNVDAAVTVAIGGVSAEARKLIETTKKALLIGIKQAKPGNHLGDIGFAIHEYVTSRGFSIAEGLTGHGIGREVHEEPHVWNHGARGSGMELVPGMAIAIEPMVGAGKSGAIIQLPDDGYAMADGALSAHFEHTIAITKNGPIILT